MSVISIDCCYAFRVLNKSKVTGRTHDTPRLEKKKSTSNNARQTHVKIVKKLVKAYTHRSRGPDIQHIPVAGGWIKGRTVRWVMALS
jgi:hypothetical protein